MRSLIAGVGRPPVPLGQLLLPTDPHVYDDPNKAEPDQDELAALDFRVRLPVAKWSGRAPRARAVEGFDYAELYWQYGGEDVIAEGIEIEHLDAVPSAEKLGNQDGTDITRAARDQNRACFLHASLH